ncbi:MAG: EAL domain-containing protein [Alphaproteobacteria bacterium]|nr:EAL domain-containing protein [Alphaproteobacteria bacterium]
MSDASKPTLPTDVQGAQVPSVDSAQVRQGSQQMPTDAPQAGQVPTADAPQQSQGVLPDAAPLPPALAALPPLPPGATPDDMLELTFSPEVVRALLESAYSGIILYDEHSRTIWMSSRSCAITGHSLHDRYGRPGYELIHPEDLEDAARKFVYLLGAPGRSIHIEQRVVHKDGHVVWVESVLHNMLGIEPMNCIVGHYHEITERKRAHAALRESERRQRELAHRDHLTGLLNRRAISAELERMVAALDRGDVPDFAFLYVDLDGFKKVNDRLGHAFGDEYLRVTAARLQEAVPETDAVARVGGDEFAILASSCDTRSGAERLADRVVHALTDPVRIRGHLVQLPACVGVVTAGGRSWRPMDYLRHADAALYAAKQEGTGRVRVFDESLERHLNEQTTLAAELASALEQGQLDLLYQPIVDLSDRSVVGLEALICWHHPRRGLLRAGSFISAAEETGLVIPIGEWVFDQVCADTARWQATFGDRAPWVSANLAAAQLIRQDFPDFVKNTVERHGIEAGQVRFELTERGLFETEGPWRDRLWQAQAAGVPLMIDDFGIGYTSLRYLAEFPVSVLKLDREYVAKTDAADLQRRERGQALMRAVAQLGRSLDLAIVAEGVETEAQHAAAVDAGCTLGQGWLYARAMGGDQVDEHLRGDRWRL